MKYYLGIDNGITGDFSFLSEDKLDMFYSRMPVKKMFDYTKSGQKINRIDHEKLKKMLSKLILKSKSTFCLVEKAFTNPKMYKASISGAKSLESVLIILEQLFIPYEIISSKKWQNEMLKGIKGNKDLKAAGLQLGKRLFPNLKKILKTDCDGLLLAEYARRMRL